MASRNPDAVTDTAPFRDILIEHDFIRQPPRPGEPLKPGKHTIQGIGAGFIPDTLDLKMVDRVEQVTDDGALRHNLAQVFFFGDRHVQAWGRRAQRRRAAGGGGDQLGPAGHVDAHEARMGDGRARHPQVDLGRPGPPQQLGRIILRPRLRDTASRNQTDQMVARTERPADRLDQLPRQIGRPLRRRRLAGQADQKFRAGEAGFIGGGVTGGYLRFNSSSRIPASEPIAP